MPFRETRWITWLKRLLGLAKQTAPEAQEPKNVPTVSPMIPLGGVVHDVSAAISEFGESFIGVVEIGPQGPRVTAGTYAKHSNHLTLSKQNLGLLQIDQRRFGFIRNNRGVTIGPSSTGAIPTLDEIPVIHAALHQQGYLIPGGLYLIVVENGKGEQHLYNLLNGERIQ